MSLATRCTACGTVFRVVQEQLQVSEGWVRCGRCQEVFNALERLFDLDASPSAAAPLGAPSGPVPFDPAAQPSPDEAGPAAAVTVAETTQIDTVVESRASSRPGSDASTSAAADSEIADNGDFADARFNTSLLAADAAADAAAMPSDAAPETLLDEVADAPSAPSFVTDAERSARWRRPGVRIAMMLGTAALLALLALQVSLQFHDAMAARWPALRVPMAALCEAAGCTVGPPREIDAVSVDSSGLVRAGDGGAYRLSLVLRNRAEYAVAPPSVELSVTDSNGQLVARRVFAPADFAAPQGLAPLAETPLQLMLAGGERISGYTIELFYP